MGSQRVGHDWTASHLTFKKSSKTSSAYYRKMTHGRCWPGISLSLHCAVCFGELTPWPYLFSHNVYYGRPNQSILKEINPEYSLEGLMLKLKFKYFGHLMQRADSLEKTMMLEKIEGRRGEGDRGWDGWWHHLLNGHEFEQTPWHSGGQGTLACCSPWSGKESDMT